jgi:hypothetical protein
VVPAWLPLAGSGEQEFGKWHSGQQDAVEMLAANNHSAVISTLQRQHSIRLEAQSRAKKHGLLFMLVI